MFALVSFSAVDRGRHFLQASQEIHGELLPHSTYFNSLKNQMRVFEEISKIKNPVLIHPSDKKYTKALEKKQLIAKNNGGFVNPLFFQARIVRISSNTIRAVQNAIITGMSLAGFMATLIARLAPG